MWWVYPLFALGSYLIGSIPFSLLVGRRLRGVDIREYGSGKTGFTNSLRTLGIGPSLVVFLGDLAKGAAPVLVARSLSPHASLQVVAAVCTVAGHDWPVFAKFKGGRGVTTSLGATTAMVPPVGLALLVLGAVLLYIYRYVSLTSILTTLTGAILVWLLVILGRAPRSYSVWASVAAPLIVILHRDNLERLRNGTEPKIGQGAKPRTSPGNTSA